MNERDDEREEIIEDVEEITDVAGENVGTVSEESISDIDFEAEVMRRIEALEARFAEIDSREEARAKRRQGFFKPVEGYRDGGELASEDVITLDNLYTERRERK